MAVAIVSQILRACNHLEHFHLTPSLEHIISRFSKLALGVRHQGWQIQCEPVTIPGLLSRKQAAEYSIDKKSGHADDALPYSKDLSVLLSGQIKDGAVSFPCSAMWVWKTQAAHVKEGEVVAVKPDAANGGLGCGPAREGEAVILLLAGSGLDERGPLVAPLSWTIVRQSGLRMLIVKTRKIEEQKTSNHFAAMLQDALAGYAYLVDRLGFDPRNITLLGEGASASLCVSLTLYLSSLDRSISPTTTMRRPAKLLLFSPWCDMSVSADILREHSKVDVVDLEAQLRARDRYIATFTNRISSDKLNLLIDELSDRYGDDLSSLGRELADTVDVLGPHHPLVSPGLPVACNDYTRLAMQLLGDRGEFQPLEVLICAGSAEAHITEARSLATNLSKVDGLKIDYVEGENKVTSFSFITSGPANMRVDQLSQLFLST